MQRPLVLAGSRRVRIAGAAAILAALPFFTSSLAQQEDRPAFVIVERTATPPYSIDWLPEV